MRELGLIVVMVTNQSAMGRGTLDADALGRIHCRLVGLLAAGRAELDAIYFCPHRPEDNCPCRKPAPGMALQAARRFQADLASPSRSATSRATSNLAGGGDHAPGPHRLRRRLRAEGHAGADFIVDDLRDAAGVIRRLLAENGELAVSRLK